MTDPVTLAVLDARLSAITAEMGEALLRTAYSQGYADAMSYIDRAEMRDELERIDQAYPDAA